MKKLPKELFVKWEGDKGEEFLNASTNHATLAGEIIEETQTVGVYQLVKTVKVTLTTEVTE